MKIIHFSDPHAGGPAEDFLAYIDKRWVGVFNYRFRRRYRHDQSRLIRAVDYILSIRPDVVVCTGDLTSTGQPGEFAKIKPILQPLRDSGIPILYTPGNHDCYVSRPKCRKAVREMVDYLSRGEYQFDEFPLVRQINGVNFLLVNTSRPSNLLCSWGFLYRKDQEFLRRECERLAGAGPRIMINHYPIYEDHPWLRTRHRLFGEAPVRKMIEEEHLLELSLCGHVHAPYCRVNEMGHGENCAGSITLNGTMMEINCDTQSGKFSFHQISL